MADIFQKHLFNPKSEPFCDQGIEGSNNNNADYDDDNNVNENNGDYDDDDDDAEDDEHDDDDENEDDEHDERKVKQTGTDTAELWAAQPVTKVTS